MQVKSVSIYEYGTRRLRIHIIALRNAEIQSLIQLRSAIKVVKEMRLDAIIIRKWRTGCSIDVNVMTKFVQFDYFARRPIKATATQRIDRSQQTDPNKKLWYNNNLGLSKREIMRRSINCNIFPSWFCPPNPNGWIGFDEKQRQTVE